jgi:hypothetical protein
VLVFLSLVALVLSTQIRGEPPSTLVFYVLEVFTAALPAYLSSLVHVQPVFIALRDPLLRPNLNALLEHIARLNPLKLPSVPLAHIPTAYRELQKLIRVSLARLDTIVTHQDLSNLLEGVLLDTIALEALPNTPQRME